jgi:hypothetical protein
MRIAKLHLDPQDKLRFEIHGKGSVKYHLKANHVVEAKRWYWTLNNAIQQTKDEARLEAKRIQEENEAMGRLREQAHQEESAMESDAISGAPSGAEDMGRRKSVVTPESRVSALERRKSVRQSVVSPPERRGSVLEKRKSVRKNSVYGGGYQSDAASIGPKTYSVHMDGDLGDDEEDEDDDVSSHGPSPPPTTEALNLAANSARLQLDLISQVALALQFEHANNPDLRLGDSPVVAAFSSYESAVGSLKQLIGDLLTMSKERDMYWRYRMEKEVALRRLWEENMAKLAEEQEALEGQMVGERERRKKTKRALKRVLRKDSGKQSSFGIPPYDIVEEEGVENLDQRLQELALTQEGSARRSVEISSELSETDESEEFFDAIDAGEVKVVEALPSALGRTPTTYVEAEEGEDETAVTPRHKKLVAVKTSFIGYEEPPRKRLTMDADDRPKISLWVSCPRISQIE